MLYKKEGLESMESIEASLLRLADLWSDEPDSEQKREILAYRQKAVAAYQSLLSGLYELSAVLENDNHLF